MSNASTRCSIGDRDARHRRRRGQILVGIAACLVATSILAAGVDKWQDAADRAT
jgi:hypothetical protein